MRFTGVCGDVFSEGIGHQSGHPFIAFRFDGLRSIGERFFDISHDGSFVFELRPRRILLGGQCLPKGNIGEEIVCRGAMNHPLRKRARRGSGLEVVLAFRKILGHGDEFSADFIPLFQQSRRRTGRGFRRGGIFR